MGPLSGFEPALVGDIVVHDGVTACGTIGPHPSVPPTVLVEHKPVAMAGCIVACTGATAGVPMHPPAPATVVASLASVHIGNMPIALRAPSPDLTTCGAMLGSPTAPKSGSVVVGVYVPLPPGK